VDLVVEVVVVLLLLLLLLLLEILGPARGRACATLVAVPPLPNSGT
jgi:hypothetical protein